MDNNLFIAKILLLIFCALRDSMTEVSTMYRSQLIHCLKLAFFPVIACILLAGHASGQAPTRIMSPGNAITASSGCGSAKDIHSRCHLLVKELNQLKQ
ncbi:hypothetical protein [Cellvibrio sp. ARAG 10.3]|uniref:hypothetical protein n=1 Tax=Cellvibrio sp. ARAG 10.3 TaxID=3451358 RepID=UPI003F6DCBB3